MHHTHDAVLELRLELLVHCESDCGPRPLAVPFTEPLLHILQECKGYALLVHFVS